MSANSLIFTKLKKGNIFNQEFEELTKNNVIEFPKDKISVVYAPNGTGKTTLSRILRGDSDCEFDFTYNSKKYTTNDNSEKVFYVISNQIERHVIKGNTDEYILGENIAQERAKKVEYEQAYQTVFVNIQNVLKNEFIVTKQTCNFFSIIKDDDLLNLIKAVSKRGSKYSDIDVNDFVKVLSKLKKEEKDDYNGEKLSFLINDFSNIQKDSLIEKIRKINQEKITKNEDIRVIQRNKDAIPLLKKYIDSTACVVCDTNGINPQNLIVSKQKREENVISQLDDDAKKIIQEIIDKVPDNAFGISNILLDLLEKQDSSSICSLLEEFKQYEDIAYSVLKNKLAECFSGTNLLSLFGEYNKIFNEKIELQQEDEVLIQDIIANSIGKTISLERDKEKNIIIKINDAKLLGSDLEKLELSTGEANFISLTFELLKAKRAKEPIVIVDDPISSFDSIYKNKIAFCLLKILESKSKIVLTHNLDLVRLLDVQITHCFSFYLLSNDPCNECGFIRVCEEERDLVLYFDKLLDKLRSSDIETEVTNKREYILSLVPFMRALLKIMNPKEKLQYIKNLTSIMHGYSSDIIDINPIYNFIFSKEESDFLNVSTMDILSINLDNLDFFKHDKLPLLSKTLKHTLVYLYLRLSVEKCLYTKFPEEAKGKELLGEIIHSTLKDSKYMRFRVELTSKKTLLNEFNHYEGNFNLFQPAIDITDSSLEKEKNDILIIISEINTIDNTQETNNAN